ncbi:hypothetical protein L6V77_30020 [Myxococcota bacterium]|nr:hypothetical protein [Myxococcota bacterium]
MNRPILSAASTVSRLGLVLALAVGPWACQGRTDPPDSPSTREPAATQATQANSQPTGTQATSQPTAAAGLSLPPAVVASLLPPYLKIQEALAGDSTVGVPEAARELAAAAKAGNAATLAAAADALAATDAANIKALRDAFKVFSNPFSEAALADPETKAKYMVVHCDMAPGTWVQRHRTIRNPYYGAEMLECGDPKN